MSLQEDWRGGYLPEGVYPVKITGHSFEENTASGTTWLKFAVTSANYETGKIDFAITQKAFWRFIAFAKACRITEEESALIEVRHWKSDFKEKVDGVKAFYDRWFIAEAERRDKYVNIEGFRTMDGPPPKMGEGPAPQQAKPTEEPVQEEQPTEVKSEDDLPF